MVYTPMVIYPLKRFQQNPPDGSFNPHGVASGKRLQFAIEHGDRNRNSFFTPKQTVMFDSFLYVYHSEPFVRG